MKLIASETKRTKKDRAVDLYKTTMNLAPDKRIRAFMRELDLPTSNTARTYISLSRKALALSHDINYKPRKIDSRKTKRGRAMALFNTNQALSRKEMINLFVEKLEITESSASVHCSNCSQEYSGPRHNAIV